MSVILNPIIVLSCQVMMKEIGRLLVTFPVTQPYSKNIDQYPTCSLTLSYAYLSVCPRK